MILFIWVSIHKPHVDKEIIVKNSFRLRGIEIVLRLFSEEVISRILRMLVFIYILLIRFIGMVLKNIIVPSMVIRVWVFFVMLFIMALNILFLLGIIMSFLGFIRTVKIIFDKMFNIIIIMASLGLKMAFR